MKPRGDKLPGLVLEGDSELELTLEALIFAEQPLHQELNDGYQFLVQRVEDLIARLQHPPHDASDSSQHVFVYAEPEAGYIMDALHVTSERSRDQRHAKQAAKMLNHFRLSRFSIVRND